MIYLNQLDYSDLSYPTYAKQEVPKNSTVRSSGCGLCCICMVVDGLTLKTLSIEECVRIAMDCGANHSRGTDMTVLAPVIAEQFGLDYKGTAELSEVIEHLKNGGKAIAHVGVPEGAEIGLFTKGGHYITLIATDGECFTVLDPSYSETKFDIPERAGRLDASNAPFLSCPVETLHAETKPRLTKYYLFARKK